LKKDKVGIVDPLDCPSVWQGRYGITNQENVNEVTNKTATDEKCDRVAPPSIRAKKEGSNKENRWSNQVVPRVIRRRHSTHEPYLRGHHPDGDEIKDGEGQEN